MRFPFDASYLKTTIKESCVFVKDGTHGSHKDCPNGIPLLSAKDIHHGIIDLTNNPRTISEADFQSIYRKQKPEVDDILITIVGTIGRTSVIQKDNIKFAFQRSVGWLRVNKRINPLYFNYLLQSTSVQNQLNSKTNASAQGGIYLGELEKVNLSIPSNIEQMKIADFLCALDERIRTQNKIIKDF